MDRHELTLSRCWVDGDGVVEIDLASPHLYSDGEALNDFVGALTDDVDAYDPFFGTLDDELEGGGLLVLFLDHAEIKGLEGRFVWEGRPHIKHGFPGQKKMEIDVQVFTESPYFFRASGSVRPTVPTGG